MKTSPDLLAKPTVLNDDQQEKIAEYIYNLAKSNEKELEDMKECWNYYNDVFDPNKFEYLTKIGNFSLPAKVRHIPLQRHFLDLLTSQQARRPFSFSIYAVDEKSVNNRYQRTMTEIMGYMETQIRTGVSQLLTQKQQIEMQLEQLSRVLNKEPETVDEQAQIEQLRQQMPAIQNQYQLIIDQLEDGIEISEDKINEIERKMTYDEKDMKEDYAQKILLKLRRTLNIEKKSTKNFKQQNIVGKQFYYVDYLPGHKYPIYEPVNAMKVVYPRIDSIDWVQDGPWAAISDRISWEQFEVMYGQSFIDKYGQEKYNNLMQQYGKNSGNNSVFASVPGYGAILVGENDYIYNGSDSSTFTRWRLFFKVNQRIRIKKSKNPHQEGKYFRHFINADKYLIDEDDYTYSNGYYVHNTDKKKSYKKNEIDRYSTKKGDEVIVKYIGHVYQAVVIAGEYYVDITKKEFVVRDQNDYVVTKLPIIGRTYSDQEKPYSMVKSTIDLQNLYNVIHYHQELMLALAGAKGNVIDRSQKPSTMGDEEWEYHQKMGRLYIETMDSTGRLVRNASFNQWPSFDNTLSPAIQYLENLKRSIEDTMGNIIGVTRPRTGQTVPSDQVGTYEASLGQSSLITEIIYDDHDEVERQSLVQLINLAARYCFNMETVLDIPIDGMGMEVIKIPPKIFADSFFDILIANNTSEERNMMELKQLALRQNDKNMLPFYQLLEVYKSTTLKELEKNVSYFTKKSEEIAAMQQSNSMEQQKQAQMELKKFEKDYDMAMKKIDVQVKEMELKLKEQELMQSHDQFNQEMQYKSAELATKDQTENKKIDSERQIEGSYLAVQDKHQSTDEQLRALEIQINAIQNQMNDLRTGEKNQIDNKKVATQKAPTGPKKEKIKD